MQNIILTKLAQTKETLSDQFGITKIAVFGSYAKGEEREDSDVDIVILEAKQRTIQNRLNAKKMLEEKLQKKVDIGYFDSMKTFIKNRIQKDFIYV